MKTVFITVSVIAVLAFIMVVCMYAGSRLEARFSAQHVFSEGKLYIPYAEVFTIGGGLLLWLCLSGFLAGMVLPFPK